MNSLVMLFSYTFPNLAHRVKENKHFQNCRAALRVILPTAVQIVEVICLPLLRNATTVPR